MVEPTTTVRFNAIGFLTGTSLPCSNPFLLVSGHSTPRFGVGLSRVESASILLNRPFAVYGDSGSRPRLSVRSIDETEYFDTHDSDAMWLTMSEIRNCKTK